LAASPLVHVDVIDDGEKLTTVAAQSQDFVIANHFLEHSQDPIGTIKNLMRVLKPGGILYMAVPDKRYTFDRDRPITSFQHLLDDHKNGPAATKRGHYEEYARLVNRASGPGLEVEMKKLLDMDYSIHFHVWDKKALTEFLNNMQDPLGFDLVFSMQIDIEVLNILKKRS
jgi:predicted SAM-dependent methyltransferase